MSDGNRMRARGGLVDALSSALDRGGHGIAHAPALLRQVLEDESWREFETLRGEMVRHERFTEFVVTPPLKGLGTSVDLVKRVVADDAVALDLLDQALQNQAGNPGNVDNINDRPTGTSREQALRRLRKDAPELHADVLAGRLSAHAAMVKAGFRSRTVSVPVSQPERVADALRKHMSPEDLVQLRKLLD